MIKRLFSLCLATMICLGALAAKDKVQTAFTRQVGDNTVSLQFYAPGIVRVVKYPAAPTQPQKKSYSVILKPDAKTIGQLAVSESSGELTVSSSCLQATLNLTTGQVRFATLQGQPLLGEQQTTFTLRRGDADEGKYKVSQQFRLADDEAIYGLGQLRDTAMNQRGRHVEIWNHNTYISIPYITSEKGYGLYWDNAGKSYFDDDATGTTFTSEVGLMTDYYFMYRDGTQDGVIASIRQLTGQATMFPLWTMGFWQCRERYKTSDELAEVLDRYRELGIPTDGIVQDWQYWGCDSNWNAMKFMNPYYINKVGDPQWAKYLPEDMRKLTPKTPRLKSPEEMVQYVHKNNAHLMISIWASFGPWTDQYKELEAMGALLPFDTWPRFRGVRPYDAFNPKARDIYWKYLSHLYGMGFDAWWTDSTEPDHWEAPGDDDYMTHDGTWRSVKNAFSLVSNKGIYDHQRAMKGNKKRSVQMTRSGAFGIQHYGTFSWSGDVVASWDEMKNQIPSGLNYTLCGIPFWNTDLGGFFYWEYEQDPKNPAIQELQTRWMQWGTFMPLMRNHCSSPMVSELYRFGQEGDWCYDVVKKYIQLRYRLLPYIYSHAGDCVQNSGSMMRALVMDYAADRRASRLNDEYLFGRQLLVKPVTDPLYTWKDADKKGHEIYPDLRQAAAPVSVYLPKGNDWFDFWTGRREKGGRTVQRLCPIDIMPVYVKAGAILPLGPDVQYSSEKPWDNLDIHVYAGDNGTFALYEDEGDNYNYEKGAFTTIPFAYDDATGQLTIGTRRGSYPGMLAKRQFQVTLIEGEGTQSKAITVDYIGKEVKVSLR